MAAVELAFLPEGFDRLTDAGVYLGSFDPLHRGHEWVIGQLLDRFGGAIVLVPARHFHKEVRHPANATLPRRLEMLTAFAREQPGRVAVGWAGEVLFIRLARALETRFPKLEMSFALGDETFSRLRASADYFARSGLAWTPRDETDLQAICRRAVVFGRSRRGKGLRAVPPRIGAISSTRVRSKVRQCWSDGVTAAEGWDRLSPLISRPVWRWIRRHGLYRMPADPRGVGSREGNGLPPCAAEAPEGDGQRVLE